MTLYTAILETKKIVIFVFLLKKFKHTYLQFTSIIPSPQPNLNIIYMQKDEKDKENINNKRRNKKDHT